VYQNRTGRAGAIEPRNEEEGKVANQIIVLVSDQTDEKRGRISAFDQAPQAAAFVENLLADGFDESRIRVFTGSDMAINLDYRPVVALSDDSSNDVVAVDEEWEAGLAGEAQITPPVVEYTKDGMRFSSMFSPRRIARVDMSVRREFINPE
jgi:hypothetical protein